MPLPDTFADTDPREVRLAHYFEEMYEYLLAEGVPQDRLPGPWHMLSRMVKCIDPELLQEWLDAYVAVEGDVVEEDEDEEDEEEAASPSPRPKPKRRPDYLRAIDPDPQAEEDGGHEETMVDGS